MEEKKRVLIVTQEMDPYLNLSDISKVASGLPKYLQDEGMEIRVLMPRFGNINERRHRLHEVVRLSGINIIINEDDYPLIIKVASLPGARLQVYFLDNEDFFRRKYVFTDKEDNFYEDNAERMIFFCKGVLETVKKFGWAPDIIHCHGWMTSLIPMYLNTTYKDDPIFDNSKVIYSVYEDSMQGKLDNGFVDKAAISQDIAQKDLELFSAGDSASLYKGGAEFADALIYGSENVDKKVAEYASSKNGKPILEYKEAEDVYEEYKDFYESVMEN